MSYRTALLFNLLGFFAFLILFIVITFVAAQLNTTCGPLGRLWCGDAVQRIGFPLVFMEIGGLPTPPGAVRPSGSALAFFVDVALALMGSVLAGATCQYYFGRSK